MSVDWVPTDEQTKRVTLCVALSSGNQPWDREKEALAGLGHLASLKVKETYSGHPLPFISFFSFLKKLLENVRSEASVVFVSSLGVWLGIPRTSPFLSYLYTSYPALPILDQCEVYHAGGWGEESHRHES